MLGVSFHTDNSKNLRLRQQRVQSIPVRPIQRSSASKANTKSTKHHKAVCFTWFPSDINTQIWNWSKVNAVRHQSLTCYEKNGIHAMNPNNVITCIKRWRRRVQQPNACFTSIEGRIPRAAEAETSRSLRLTGQPTGLFGQSRANDQYCLNIKKQNKQTKKQDRCCLANRTWGCPVTSTSTHRDLYTHECANTRICIYIHHKHRIIPVDSETLDEIPHTNNRTFSNLETKLHLLNFKMTLASK